MSTASTNKRPPLLSPDRIQFIKKIESKKCVFDALTALLAKGQKEVTKNDIFDALINREKLGNTNIGRGIAVPKAHLPITNPRAAILVVKKGLELGAADKQAVTFFLATLIPEDLRDQYSKTLNHLNKKLIFNGIPEKILNAKNPELLVKHFEEILYDDTQSKPSELKIK